MRNISFIAQNRSGILYCHTLHINFGHFLCRFDYGSVPPIIAHLLYIVLLLTVWLSVAVSVAMIRARIITTNTESQRVGRGKHLLIFIRRRFVTDLMDFTHKAKGAFYNFFPARCDADIVN